MIALRGAYCLRFASKIVLVPEPLFGNMHLSAFQPRLYLGLPCASTILAIHAVGDPMFHTLPANAGRENPAFRGLIRFDITPLYPIHWRS